MDIGKKKYYSVDIDNAVKFYTNSGLVKARNIESKKKYAEARAAIPVWCIDGLLCAKTLDSQKIIILVVRKGNKISDGPFKNEPWVTGGKWDMVTPWKSFILDKAKLELFGNKMQNIIVNGPIGNQLFATGWGVNGGGAYNKQGVTLQFCFQLILKEPFNEKSIQLDSNHKKVLLVSNSTKNLNLHPYINDVIKLSGWLK